VVSITSVPAPYYALQDWIGPTLSNVGYWYFVFLLTLPRMKDKLRSGEMVVSRDQWPIFLYHGCVYDPEDPWNGLFRSSLLVSVSVEFGLHSLLIIYIMNAQAYKHIFTSPSSVEKEPKATRSGNARIHGMTQVTPASIAYVATQVRTVLFIRCDIFKGHNLMPGPLRTLLLVSFFQDRHIH
jgi:hypothetical protein